MPNRIEPPSSGNRPISKRRLFKIGAVAGVCHLLITLGSAWLTMMARIAEIEQAIASPTRMTDGLLALLGVLSFPAAVLVPRLLAPAAAEALVWLILPLNSALWGLGIALAARWWSARAAR